MAFTIELRRSWKLEVGKLPLPRCRVAVAFIAVRCSSFVVRRSFRYSFVRSFVRSAIRSFVRSVIIRSLVPLFVRSFGFSFERSFGCSFDVRVDVRFDVRLLNHRVVTLSPLLSVSQSLYRYCCRWWHRRG